MNPFKLGDEAEFLPTAKALASHCTDMTVGKVYIVVRVLSTHISVMDDIGDEHDIPYMHFKLYTLRQTSVAYIPHQGAMGAGNRAKARAASTSHAFQPQYQQDPYALDAGEDEQEDYDTRKANARVTSVGLFSAGTRVMYRDGTVTLTSLTVKWCTATCVQFEETYSAAFDPNEFIVYNGDMI